MKQQVWLLFQGPRHDRRVMGVYDNEAAASEDARRLGGRDKGYSVETWFVDSEPVAS